MNFYKLKQKDKEVFFRSDEDLFSNEVITNHNSSDYNEAICDYINQGV